MQESIAENYSLDKEITDNLVIRYYPDSKPQYIDQPYQMVPPTDRLDGYTLMVRNSAGDERMVDVTCDSEFMDDVMPDVGKAIREAYHWVPHDIPIYLYMDNAGGHGKKHIVDKYVATLKDDHNVIIRHQRPRSPATNMLDLGVWMALQNVVEKLHFRQRTQVEALCRTVEEAWTKLETVKLENVYTRWLKVLDLIIEDDGGDRFVESKRGKLYNEPPDKIVSLDDDDADEEDCTEDELIAEMDAHII